MVERALHIRDVVDGDRATLAALLARAVVYGREEERTAILGAAIEMVALLGVSALTAKIVKGAGVAEGTQFAYFANKDELLNRLYQELKTDFRDAVMAGYPADKSLIGRSRRFWDRYIARGSAHPLKQKAMRQLAVSDRIPKGARSSSGAHSGRSTT